MFQIESTIEFFISKLPAEEQRIQLRLLKKYLGYAGCADGNNSSDSFILQTEKSKGEKDKSVQEVMEH